MTTDYASYWNAYASKVGHRTAVTPLSEQEYRNLYLDELKQLGPANPKRILDYGCGPALLLPIIKELWPESKYTGVDISREMIEHCWSQWHDKNFSESEFYVLPSDELILHYDFLICHSVFTHIQLTDAVALLKTLHKLIAPGGFASISILDEPMQDANFFGCLERVDYNFRFFQGMLVQAGFSIEKIYRRHQCYFGVRKV